MNELKRILVLGSGAREHALQLALQRPGREVIVAPGNGGTDPNLREFVNLLDLSNVVELAQRLSPDLVVIGPEAPLCLGVADALQYAGFRVFGPDRAAATLEGSKAFLKELIAEAGIPTADFAVVRSMAAAEKVIRERGAPIVIKADGLCAGKGVVVAKTVEEALAAARQMLVERVFGDAGSTVVIEQCLVGREVSLHAITDGERFVLLPPARDHKRLADGDSGPNTGGMGVVCPAPDVDAALCERIGREVIEPTLAAMRKRGTPFRGVLFAGLMVTPEGEPFLLEHNVRFGDPECEALMPLLEGDLGALLLSVAEGALDATQVSVVQSKHSVVVVLAAAGYPDKPEKGAVLSGLDEAEATDGALVLHAGTEARGEALVVNGGRVLAVRGVGHSLSEARAKAYEAVQRISFQGRQFRKDIGA